MFKKKKKDNVYTRYKKKLEELTPAQQDSVKVLTKFIYVSLLLIVIISLAIIGVVIHNIIFTFIAILLVIPAQLVFNSMIRSIPKDNDLPELQ